MKKLIYVIGGVLITTLAFILFISNVPNVGANPSQLPIHGNCKTSSSTSSPYYIVANTATSTLTCDAYNLDTNNVNPLSLNTASLLVRYQGSSTASIMNIKFEYSNDGSDWYQNTLGQVSFATSTQVKLGTLNSYSWQYSSSTNLGGGSLVSATSTRIIDVPVPTRYVRVIFSSEVAVYNGAVWAELVPKQEVR